jgi:hypothetical protein
MEEKKKLFRRPRGIEKLKKNKIISLGKKTKNLKILKEDLLVLQNFQNK